ncbi:MAG: LptA/OstA family protein [Puniceicoccales bacterium]|jgi:lipopolysaccharide export system protein LptA|nr:LptA/OstA family protein [Puniceicoccales bacterium]
MFAVKTIPGLIILMLPLGIFASPAQITSDVLEIRTLGPHVHMHFSHSAHIEGDKFSLKGDHIQVIIVGGSPQNPNPSAVKEIHAMGNAALEWELYGGKADQISIYPAKNFILLEGNAEIWDEGSGTMFGQTLILDLKNRRIKSEGSEFKRSTMSINDISKFEPNNMLIK